MSRQCYGCIRLLPKLQLQLIVFQSMRQALVVHWLAVSVILEVQDITFAYGTYVTHTYLGRNNPDIVILHLYLSFPFRTSS